MENKYKENLKKISEQNEKNLSLLIDNLVVKQNKQKKLKVSWKKLKNNSQKQGVNAKQKIQIDKNIDLYQKYVKNNPCQKAIKPQIQQKKVVPPGEFVSAGSLLPKGTSIRKKFVPPFKRNQSDTVQQQKPQQQQQCKDPAFKNLQDKLVNIIMSQILQKSQNVKWSEIAGLGFAKKIIHEMIVWPMQRPDIFTGLRAPPRAILLFGPPGTGKTMIGRAIASDANATFFSISASSLTSKWVGESEKLVKTLFAIARNKQPSVIFIDQIDSLLSVRSEGQQQSSRRLDGAKGNSNQRVLIIGATNLPQQLDDAVRRRFVKRLYIPLPNLQGRVQLIKTLTNNITFHLTDDDIILLAKKARGFSGADLYSLCSQASMIPLRQISSIKDIRQSEVPQSQVKHFEQAFKLVRPSVNKKMLKSFQQFNMSYGSYQFNQEQVEDIDN